MTSLLLSGCKTLEDLKKTCESCYNCSLGKTRTNLVFQDGNPNAKLMFIGEGPGEQEDKTGIPFVGRAGQLLTQIIESVGLDRQTDTYICNIVKCRPPNNRVPSEDEMRSCSAYLDTQIDLIKPKIIVLVGSTAVKGILNLNSGITAIRGQWYTSEKYQAKIMPIFHPAYLLRNPSKEPGKPKWLMWQDIKEIKRMMTEENLILS